jgi:hypothetical protein
MGLSPVSHDGMWLLNPAVIGVLGIGLLITETAMLSVHGVDGIALIASIGDENG